MTEETLQQLQKAIEHQNGFLAGLFIIVLLVALVKLATWLSDTFEKEDKNKRKQITEEIKKQLTEERKNNENM